MVKIIFSVIAIGFGVFFFIFGGWDDSPGAQGIGLLSFIAGIVILIKSRRKSR